MERLTKRISEGYAYIPCHWKEVAEAVDKGQERLAAIEDILGDDYDLSRLRELVQADRDGRCVVLPDRKQTSDNGEKALKSAMNTLYYHNNPVTRYIADAVAEKLTREAAEEAMKGENRMNNLRWKKFWIKFQGDGRFSKERIKGKDKRQLRKWTIRKLRKMREDNEDFMLDKTAFTKREDAGEEMRGEKHG